MFDDTLIGGRGEKFPATRHSAIVALRSGIEADRTRAYQSVVAAYWKPVYKYIRIKRNKSNEDAKDLTQGFFAKVMEKEFFNGYDETKGRFRTFLRVCLDGYIANEEKAASRLKRGGGVQLLSLDFKNVEDEMASIDVASDDAPDELFDKEWVRTIFTIALERFRIECEEKGKTIQFKVFESYHLSDDSPSYDQLAAEFGLPVTQINNYLSYGRREFRRIALEKLREITASDEEFRSEARALFGITPP